MKHLVNGLGKAFIRFLLLLMAGWATVAIFYSNLPVFIRQWVAGIFAIGSLLVLVGKYSTWRTRLGFLTVSHWCSPGG